MINKIFLTVALLVPFCCINANEWKPPHYYFDFEEAFNEFNEKMIKAGEKPFLSMDGIEDELEARGRDRNEFLIFLFEKMKKAPSGPIMRAEETFITIRAQIDVGTPLSVWLFSHKNDTADDKHDEDVDSEIYEHKCKTKYIFIREEQNDEYSNEAIVFTAFLVLISILFIYKFQHGKKEGDNDD